MKRRDFLSKSAGIGVGLFATGCGSRDLQPTRSDILGPYYLPEAPWRDTTVPGGDLLVHGSVRSTDGTPIADAIIEVWHAGPDRLYGGLDACRARLRTTSAGEYAVTAMQPDPYKMGPEDWRPAHIHLSVVADHHQTLVTQIYFAGDPYLTSDPYHTPERVFTPTKTADGRAIRFDIVLQTGTSRAVGS